MEKLKLGREMTLNDMLEMKYTITFKAGTLHYINDDESHEGMMTLTVDEMNNLKWNAMQLYLLGIGND